MHRILLVDDIASTRMLFAKALRTIEAAVVSSAEDGAQALKLLEDDTFDLVVTDWQMPNVNGIQLLTAIRTVSPELPVIMLSSSSDRESVCEAIDAGVTDYLVKPTTIEMIRSRSIQALEETIEEEDHVCVA